ncbi:Ubiquitin carboxyl-terminal hydrolase 14 [Nosema bombycis CQ1]|uniref:Ubiquitin carboxyl-terminal hydrolase 14 n=2 Tax=Nosema bombycis (strain CQ1 / CVCC 102059) TaxID=578461 RepID=R0MIB3_NOSB1|nr:Ubiquitin carboxyl-terminal hydrolase 14 [Nosema bombycis CQ1]|eukprot:EOB13870.1 Ubiquitin carboxyl-terminal hydrolase 14 [Nosema bombycis CQ1]
MGFLNYSKLRESCSYCFKNISDGINICECILSFCDEHYPLHKNRSSCSKLLHLKINGSVVISDCDLPDEEKSKIIKRIEMIMKCKNYDEKVIFKDGEIECPHLKKAPEVFKIDFHKKLKCKKCPLNKHLYLCLTCGELGCGRVQYGIEGNGHALEHFKITDHEVYVLVQSITPEYVCDTFCYKCNDFIENPFCDEQIQCSDFTEPGNPIFDVNLKGELTEPVSDPSPFLGIKNAGNTCYISSVLQLFGFIISKRDISLNEHFIFCEHLNPLNCLYCQTIRILNEMKKKMLTFTKGNRKVPFEFIPISDFLKLIWTEIPLFTKNAQHDANEFLMIFTQKIKEGEELGHFPPITPLFTFEVENSIWCDLCKKCTSSRESHFMAYTPFNVHVQGSLDLYFKSYQTPCGCGGEMWISNKIISLPSFFIVTIGRIVFKNENFYKITDSVGVDQINLSPYLRKAKISNFFTQELKVKGFTEGEINLALSDTNNFENLEERIDEYRKMHKTNPKYGIGGAIIHSGNSMNSGHYMWWVKTSTDTYLVNDRRTTLDGIETLENSYILIFE